MDGSLVSWLLSAHTPTIRYLTLRHLLHRDDQDDRVRAAREEIMSHGPVPGILAGQADDGHWAHERGYYTPKYTSSHWSMLLLCELEAGGPDERLQRGAASMLCRTDGELRQELDVGRAGLVCFWANLLRYSLYAGLDDDPRVGRVIAYIVSNAGSGAGWRCRHNGDQSCAWGAARALWGLGALPSEGRGGDVAAAIASAAEFLLGGSCLLSGGYPTSGRPHRLWGRLNAMLFYQTDVLFVLRALADAGALAHLGAQEPLAWLRARADSSGRWRGAHPYGRRTWPLFDDAEEVDRWVSLQAVMVLRRAEGARGGVAA